MIERQKFTVDLHAGPFGEIVEIDSHTWWMASHCGPGSVDSSDICGFCGQSAETCAKQNTNSIKDNHFQFCGGSGFWCTACGLFWAQDACGELYNTELRNVNPDLHLYEADGIVHCSCGNALFSVENPEELGNE